MANIIFMRKYFSKHPNATLNDKEGNLMKYNFLS